MELPLAGVARRAGGRVGGNDTAAPPVLTLTRGVDFDGQHACPGAPHAPDIAVGVARGRALLWVTTEAFHAESSGTA